MSVDPTGMKAVVLAQQEKQAVARQRVDAAHREATAKHQRNLQEAFDAVWAGFAAQGWVHATDSWGHDSNGMPLPVLLDRSANRCALGHLVTDAGVGQAVTGQSQALLQGTDAEFYRDLRKAHDETTKQGPSALRASLRDVASRYGLTVPEKE